jgi:uncharacterized membrane protein
MAWDLILYFSIYSFLGWVMETTYASIIQRKFINRGFLNGPFTPIYGFGAVLIIQSLKWIENIYGNNYTSVLMCIIISTLLVTLLEFITGFTLEKMFNSKWWDYSDYAMNIMGYICLKYSLLWGILAFFLIKIVHPIIVQFTYPVPVLAKIIISSLLIIHFLFDTLKSIAGMLDLRKAIVNYSDLSVNKYKEIIIKYKRFFLAFPRLLFLNAGILNRDVRGILNERINILNDRINKIKVEIKSRFQT